MANTVKDEIETWEMQTGGTVYVEVTVDKIRGTTRNRKMSGKGARLRIPKEDRVLTQERIRNKVNDPFTNGLLMRVDADQNTDEETASNSAKDDAALLELLQHKQGARLKKELEDLSEVAFRRFRKLTAENEDVTSAQSKAIEAVYDEKYSPNRYLDGPAEQSPEKIAASFPEMNLSGGVRKE